MGTNGQHHVPSLLAHYALLGAVAILTGIVHQLPSWREIFGVDPGLLPFLLMILAGFLTSLISSFLEGTMAGLYVGFLAAVSGTIFEHLSGPVPADGFRTVFAYLIIMTCLGPLFGACGAVGGSILRHFVGRRGDNELHLHTPD